MITRTITATCDGTTDEGLCCDIEVELSPTTTQPYRDLTDLGWTNTIVGEEIFLFCPDHGGQGNRA